MVASAWYGVVLPAGASADVVNRLNTEINKILNTKEINNKLVEMGAEVLGGSAAEFAKFSISELKRYESIVKNSGAPKE
jgi:tripartite-type tricarboxylate transporter receptor subunit TctC